MFAVGSARFADSCRPAKRAGSCISCCAELRPDRASMLVPYLAVRTIADRRSDGHRSIPGTSTGWIADEEGDEFSGYSQGHDERI